MEILLLSSCVMIFLALLAFAKATKNNNIQMESNMTVNTVLKQPIPWQKSLILGAISKLRVNVKSLAAESKYIRDEVKKCRCESQKGVLNTHRIEVVRKEARSAQLALACLRSTPYNVCERDAKSQPDWNRIKEKLHRLIWDGKLREEFDKWLKEGQSEFG